MIMINKRSKITTISFDADGTLVTSSSPIGMAGVAAAACLGELGHTLG